MNFSLGTITLAVTLLGAWEMLTSAYLVFLIVGGGLLVIATVFGGDGQDADLGGMDADLDIDLDVDDLELDGATGDVEGVSAAHAHVEAGAGALALSNWLSFRFFVYFSAMFGLVGTVLSRMTDVSPGAVLVAALVGGIAVGQIAQQTIRALQRSSSNSEMKTEDFVNQVARVTASVVPPKRGEVGVRMGNKECFLPATARRMDDRFKVGDRVVIVAYAGGTAEIVSREEHAFLKDS